MLSDLVRVKTFGDNYDAIGMRGAQMGMGVKSD